MLAQHPTPCIRRHCCHHEHPAPSPVWPCPRNGRAALAARLNLKRWDIASRRRGIFQTSRSPHTCLSRCMPCPPLAKVSIRQNLPKTSEACSPRCGCSAPQPSEGAEPAGSEAHIFPGSPSACQETRVSGTSLGEASASKCAEQEPHPGTVRDYHQSRPRPASNKGEGQRGERQRAAQCQLPRHKNPPGRRQRQWVRAAQALQSGVLQDQQYQTPHLPGCPRQLVQPCGTIIPILQAHRDVPTVLVLPEPELLCLHRPACAG